MLAPHSAMVAGNMIKVDHAPKLHYGKFRLCPWEMHEQMAREPEMLPFQIDHDRATLKSRRKCAAPTPLDELGSNTITKIFNRKPYSLHIIY